jgi:sporulation protein YabP
MVENRREEIHSFISRAREGIKIDGVREVISFDEGGVMLDTLCGRMAIEGEDLHVTVLNITDGKVEVEGRVNGVYYIDDKPTAKRGLFGRRTD